MKLHEITNVQTEYEKQVDIAMKFIASGELSRLHHSQTEDVVDTLSNGEMEEILKDVTFLK
jgi:hypothetical protein